MFQQTTDVFEVDVCTRRSMPCSHYMLISIRLSQQDMEGEGGGVITSYKAKQTTVV